ncbi:hypothetical protein D3C85_1832110 [compost metagenome]
MGRVIRGQVYCLPRLRFLEVIAAAAEHGAEILGLNAGAQYGKQGGQQPAQ